MVMTRMINGISLPYGAFELKAQYQRNLLLGMLLTALLVAIVYGAIFFHNYPGREKIIINREPPSGTHIKSVPPPTVIRKPPQIEVQPDQAVITKFGPPKPVPDNQMPDRNVVIPTREELRGAIKPDINLDSLKASGGKIIFPFDSDDYIPRPDEFVPVEIMAEMLYQAAPDYPHLARKAGLEGKVLIRALVDKNGDVKEALVAKSSNSRAGFDEAALAAAYKCRYRPAIQNGRPVAVWVTYWVEFTLDGVR